MLKALGATRRNTRERARLLTTRLETDGPLNIVDIGARLSKTPPFYQPLLQAGVGRLSAFEPDPEAMENLQAELGDDVTLYPAAVGAPGPATFYLHKIGVLSSIFPLRPEAAKYLGKRFWINRPVEEVPVTLTALDEVEGLPDIDLLKMDVQGAELDILRHGAARLSKAVCVVPEVRFYRMYEGEPMFADVDQELRRQGFVLHKFMSLKQVRLPSRAAARLTSRAGWSQLLDGDAAYIRNLEDHEAVSDVQLARLALVADIALQSPDLCAHCLHLLAHRGTISAGLVDRYVDRLPPGLAGPRDVDQVSAGTDADLTGPMQ